MQYAHLIPWLMHLAPVTEDDIRARFSHLVGSAVHLVDMAETEGRLDHEAAMRLLLHAHYVAMEGEAFLQSPTVRVLREAMGRLSEGERGLGDCRGH